jgi:hypothetical protein
VVEAAPIFDTTIPAAVFAISQASLVLAPARSDAVKTAIKVSPAPVTS